jgi:hypothetical protein
MKTPKSSPFSHRFGRGIKGKRTTEGSCIHHLINPQENDLEISPRKSPRKALKITKKTGKNSNKPGGTTPNHLYIP